MTSAAKWLCAVGLVVAVGCGSGGGGTDEATKPSVPVASEQAEAWNGLASCAEGLGYYAGQIPGVIWRDPVADQSGTLLCCLPSSPQPTASGTPCHAGGTADALGDWDSVFLVSACTTSAGKELERSLAYWFHEGQHIVAYRNGAPDGAKAAHDHEVFALCPNPYDWSTQ